MRPPLTTYSSMADVQELLAAGARPRLIISRHDSPGEERHTRGGVARTVHVVVKNTVLPLHLQLNGAPPDVNFFSFSVDAVLLYDTEGDVEKEVDFLKVKPFSSKYVVGDSGARATVELKIKCLTSQHEDSFFRAKLIALDPRTGQPFQPSIFALSEPIKVISKPEQLKKRKIAKKRTLTDMLVETVARIEQQQQTQAALIERLTEAALHGTRKPTVAAAAAAGAAGAMEVSEGTSQPAPPPAPAAEQPVEFEVAFSHFLASYHALPSEERAEKIRRLVRAGSSSDTEKLRELIDLFTTEGLNQPPPGADGSNPGASCQCAACPHRAELLKIDDFYKEFLSSPLLGDAMPPHLMGSMPSFR